MQGGERITNAATAEAAQGNHLTDEILIVYICVCVHRKMYEKKIKQCVHSGILS